MASWVTAQDALLLSLHKPLLPVVKQIHLLPLDHAGIAHPLAAGLQAGGLPYVRDAVDNDLITVLRAEPEGEDAAVEPVIGADFNILFVGICAAGLHGADLLSRVSGG